MNNEREPMTGEIERLLRENLKLMKETHDYARRIDRRQRWSRNWTAFYWTMLFALALFGSIYAFPYLKTISETVSSSWNAISGMASFKEQTPNAQ